MKRKLYSRFKDCSFLLYLAYRYLLIKSSSLYCCIFWYLWRVTFWHLNGADLCHRFFTVDLFLFSVHFNIVMNCWQTHFLEQGPSGEGDNHSAADRISCLLWNPKVYYSILKRLAWDPIPSKLDPFCTFSPCLFKISFNMILSSMPVSPKFLHTWDFSAVVCMLRITGQCLRPL
jgi:hypothetical protein